MKENPRITIVTPSFNQSAYIRETIESVLSQGYSNLDYMVLDGGSTDGSVEIIREYEKELSFWRSFPDEGQTSALIEGFDRADGEILAWLNSDDVLEPGALSAVADAWDQFGPGVIVTGGCRVFEEGPDSIHWPSFIEQNQSKPIPIDKLLNLGKNWLTGDFFYQPETFFPAAEYRAVGGLNSTFYFAMDYDLWVRLAIHGTSIVNLDTTIAGFRKHPEQKTALRHQVRAELIETANKYLEGEGTKLSSKSRM